MAELDCNTNVMNVNWTQTTSSAEYTAWAIGTDGHRASCNSTSNYCSIHQLRCGRIYEVAVTSSSINCEIIAGSDYKVQSGEWTRLSVDPFCVYTSQCKTKYLSTKHVLNLLQLPVKPRTPQLS